MVSTRWCRSRRFLSHLAYALFVFCFFVVLSGLGILSRLPEEVSSDRHVNVVQPAIQTWKEQTPLEPDWKISNNKFHNYESQPDVWQRANPTWKPEKLLVYSAYWDDRVKPKCVRIIGTTLVKKAPSVGCLLHFEGAKTVNITAQKKAINEHWNLKYAGYFFSCCSDNFGKLVPANVTVYDESHKNVSVTLTIHQNQLENGPVYKGQLALCVKPFHYNFNRAVWLLEFIEFYRLLGVEHFLFYNESVGDDVQELLIYYQKLNIVRVLPWGMDVENQKEIRTQNLFSALNDCNYRLMYLYKFVMFVDFDEYIVPKQHNNLTHMMNSLWKDKTCAPSFIFRNAFYYLYWDNDTSLFEVGPETPPRNVPYLLTVYKTRRLSEPHLHGKRSKFIAMPEKVVEVGNHVTWRHTGTCRPEKVPQEVALVQHYRICEFGGFDCLKLSSKVDRTAHKYGQQLLDRVLDACAIIYPSLEGQCPISPPLGSPW